MTGRGDGRLFRPSANPAVKIGISLSTSSPILDPSSSTPFFLIVTAHILENPRLGSPITLTTHLNPFGFLGNRSFHNIACTFPETNSSKCIKIWPIGWPHYIWNRDNLRDSWEFVTVPANGALVTKHQLDPKKIAEAKLKIGEKYQVSFTDKCLGTRWWAYGSLEEFEGVRFGQWRKEEEKEESEREEEEEEGEGEGTEAKESEYDGKLLMGEIPDDLAFVIQEGTAEFEIGSVSKLDEREKISSALGKIDLEHIVEE